MCELELKLIMIIFIARKVKIVLITIIIQRFLTIWITIATSSFIKLNKLKFLLTQAKTRFKRSIMLQELTQNKPNYAYKYNGLEFPFGPRCLYAHHF